jgi:hypothetical protein
MPKNTTPADPRDFQSKLKQLTEYLSLKEISTLLFGSEQKKWQVGNWLYRDRPNEWAVRSLLPIIEKQLTRSKKTRHEQKENKAVQPVDKS